MAGAREPRRLPHGRVEVVEPEALKEKHRQLALDVARQYEGVPA